MDEFPGLLDDLRELVDWRWGGRGVGAMRLGREIVHSVQPDHIRRLGCIGVASGAGPPRLDVGMESWRADRSHVRGVALRDADTCSVVAQQISHAVETFWTELVVGEAAEELAHENIHFTAGGYLAGAYGGGMFWAFPGPHVAFDHVYTSAPGMFVVVLEEDVGVWILFDRPDGDGDRGLGRGA